MDVIIIGTDPPCPRCDILGLWVDEVIAENDHKASIKVAHLSFNDPAAIDFGAKKGLIIGTAKQIALSAGIDFDKAKLEEWTSKRILEIDEYNRPADIWNEEFDHMLSQYQKAADGISFLMTPVLVIDGVVKHHGSVPKKAQLRKWIEESV